MTSAALTASESSDGRVGAYGAILGQTLIASCTYLVAKEALASTTPAQLLCLRVVVAAPVLALLLWRFGAAVARADHVRLFFLGLLGVPLNQGLFLWGISESTPARASLLFALTPLVVAAFAHFLLRERLTRRRVVGSIIALSGVAIVLAERGLSLGAGLLGGDFIVLAAVFFWALYSVLAKRLTARYGVLTVTAASLLYGTAAMAPFEVYVLGALPFEALPASAWLAVVFLALVTSILSYLLWHHALRRLPAARVTIFANLQPVLTGALSVAFFGESLPWAIFVGGALVLFGVVTVQRG